MTSEMLLTTSDPKGSYSVFIGNEAEKDVMDFLDPFLK